MNGTEPELEDKQVCMNAAIGDTCISTTDGGRRAVKNCVDVIGIDVIEENRGKEVDVPEMTTENGLQIHLCCEAELPIDEVPPSPGLDFLDVCEQHGAASRKSSEGGKCAYLFQGCTCKEMWYFNTDFL